MLKNHDLQGIVCRDQETIHESGEMEIIAFCKFAFLVTRDYLG